MQTSILDVTCRSFVVERNDKVVNCVRATNQDDKKTPYTYTVWVNQVLKLKRKFLKCFWNVYQFVPISLTKSLGWKCKKVKKSGFLERKLKNTQCLDRIFILNFKLISKAKWDIKNSLAQFQIGAFHHITFELELIEFNRWFVFPIIQVDEIQKRKFKACQVSIWYLDSQWKWKWKY